MSVRHSLYAKHGQFGKILAKQVFEPFKQLEATVGGGPSAKQREQSQAMTDAMRS